MQDQCLDTFMHTLECAVRFGMPRLLACCEHHISVDPKKRFQPISAHLGGLLPHSSVTRVADSLQGAIQGMAAKLAYEQRSLGSSSAYDSGRNAIGAVGNLPCWKYGKSSSEDFARAFLSKYVPSPKSFLEMAHPVLPTKVDSETSACTMWHQGGGNTRRMWGPHKGHQRVRCLVWAGDHLGLCPGVAPKLL